LKPYSYSQIRQHLDCPVAAQRRRAGDRGDAGPLAAEGRLCHEILEAYGRHCVANSQATDLSALRGIAADCYAVYLDAPDGMVQVNQQRFEELVRDVIVPFSETRLFDLSTIGDFEMRIALDLRGEPVGFDSEDAWFRGVLDVVHFLPGNRARIEDYKTGFGTDKDPLQLRVYGWLLMAVYPHLEEVDVVFDYVRFNKRVGETLTREDAAAAEAEVRRIIADMEARSEQPYRPGPQCVYCDFATSCAKVPEAVTESMIDDEAEAREVVEQIALLERDLGLQKDRLRAYCTRHGNVVHNGWDYGFHASGGPKFADAERFFHAAKEDGVSNPFDYLSVNNTKAAKLRKKGEYPEHLAAEAAPDITVKFGHRNVKGE